MFLVVVASGLKTVNDYVRKCVDVKYTSMYNESSKNKTFFFKEKTIKANIFTKLAKKTFKKAIDFTRLAKKTLKQAIVFTRLTKKTLK